MNLRNLILLALLKTIAPGRPRRASCRWLMPMQKCDDQKLANLKPGHAGVPMTFPIQSTAPQVVRRLADP